MRGDHRQAKIGRQIGGRRDQRFLWRVAGRMDALQFEIKGAGKQARPVARAVRGLLDIALQQRLPDVAAGRAGERDQSVDADLAQHLTRNFGAPAQPRRETGSRQQLAKLQIALVRTNEKKHSIRAVGFGLVGQKHIATEHRLDALATRRFIELDQTEQVGQIGERQRRHLASDGTRHGIVETDDAVGDGVFAVQAKMDKAGFWHPRILPFRGASKRIR